MILTQGVWFSDGEGDEEDVRVGVGEAPQSVVGLLARRVPQVELDLKYLDIAIIEQYPGIYYSLIVISKYHYQ